MQTLLKTTKAYHLLKSEGEKSRFSHAYLVHFDDQRNLKTALKLFAKILFSCENENEPAKQRIASLIEEEKFYDCLFFPKEGEKFVVEDAEILAEECLLQPVEGDKKVFVVSDFSLSTPSAQNKLLKLLEEPPKGVIFLLGATSTFSVLPTVLSRVEKLEIPAFEIEQIAKCLQRIYENSPKNYTFSDYTLSAAASGGCVSTAQSILEGGDTASLITDAFSLCLAQKKDIPMLIKKVGETKRKKEFLSLIRIILRDASILKSGVSQKEIFLQSEMERLKKVSLFYPLSTLLKSQEYISEAEQQLFFNTVFPQCVEILFIKILNDKLEKEKSAF